MILTVKPGVEFEHQTAALSHLLTTLLLLPPDDDWPEPLVITSGSEGPHAPRSRHYRGEALDLRSKPFTPNAKERFRAALEAALGPQFRVLLEYEGQPREHYHCQVKKGTAYAVVAHDAGAARSAGQAEAEAYPHTRHRPTEAR